MDEELVKVGEGREDEEDEEQVVEERVSSEIRKLRNWRSLEEEEDDEEGGHREGEARGRSRVWGCMSFIGEELVLVVAELGGGVGGGGEGEEEGGSGLKQRRRRPSTQRRRRKSPIQSKVTRSGLFIPKPLTPNP